MKAFLLLILILSTTGSTQELFNDTDEVWDKVHRGIYKIDHNSDSGHMYVPIITDDGDKIYILRDYNEMLALFRPPLIKPRYASCESCLDVESKIYPDIIKAKDSCRNLQLPPKQYKKEILSLCLNEIKKQIANDNNPMTHLKTIENLYKLPHYQQDFAAAVFTAYGEGRSEADEEIALIYKTMANRIKYARNKGCKAANALDIALQHKQFSMWNKNDPNWKKSISTREEEKSEIKQQERMINVFINFKSEKYQFDPKKIMDKIYHYRTKNIRKIPAWGKTSIAQKYVKVNGQNLGLANKKSKSAHYFFKSVPWTFRYLSIRPKQNGEEGCY